MAERDPNRGDEVETPAPPVPSKRNLRSLLIPALIVVGALALAAGAYFAGRMSGAHGDGAEVAAEPAADTPAAGNKGKQKKAAKAGAKASGKSTKAETHAPIYWGLEPAFVVNYQDSQTLRFLQVGVQVMAYDQETIDLLKANEPLVRNALLMLFSDQQYQNLITREGKDKLRASALAELRKIVDEHSGKSGPDSVYFTSFVMQ